MKLQNKYFIKTGIKISCFKIRHIYIFPFFDDKERNLARMNH